MLDKRRLNSTPFHLSRFLPLLTTMQQVALPALWYTAFGSIGQFSLPCIIESLPRSRFEARSSRPQKGASRVHKLKTEPHLKICLFSCSLRRTETSHRWRFSLCLVDWLVQGRPWLKYYECNPSLLHNLPTFSAIS